MFFDKKDEVPIARLVEWLESLEDSKWELRIWNTKKNEYEQKRFPTMLSLLKSNFRDNERVDVSVSLNLGEPFRLYIKHKNPLFKTRT